MPNKSRDTIPKIHYLHECLFPEDLLLRRKEETGASIPPPPPAICTTANILFLNYTVSYISLSVVDLDSTYHPDADPDSDFLSDVRIRICIRILLFI
jgi:hypothetical protein